MYGPYRFPRTRTVFGFLLAGAAARQATVSDTAYMIFAWSLCAVLLALTAMDFAGWLGRHRSG